VIVTIFLLPRQKRVPQQHASTEGSTGSGSEYNDQRPEDLKRYLLAAIEGKGTCIQARTRASIPLAQSCPSSTESARLVLLSSSD
jgi:hypothetical protein